MYQKIIKNSITLALIFFLNANALTLEMAINSATQDGFEFKKLENSSSSIEVSKIIAVENFLMPSVSLNETRFEHNKQDIQEFKTNTQALEVSYNLSNIYKGSLLGMQGIYTLNSQNNLLNGTKNKIILEVIEVYFDVLKSIKKIELYKKSLSLNTQILNQIETNARLGSAKNTSLYLAQTQTEEVKAELELALNDFETVKNKFILKVGLEPKNLIEPTQSKLNFNTLNELIESVEKRNFDIQSTQDEKKASKYSLAYSMTDFLPDLSIKYEKYKEHDLLIDSNYSGNRVTINAKFYLYKPGLVSSVIQKNYDYYANKNNHEFNVLSTKNIAENLWSKQEYYKTILPSKEKIVSIRRQIVEEWNTDYRYGRVDLINLLDEEKKLVEAELDLLEVKFESLKNIFSIKNIAGEKLY